MYIERLCLSNHKKIFIGIGMSVYELKPCQGINLIQGPNGAGKSTLLSELTPFPSDSSNWGDHGIKEVDFVLDRQRYHVEYHWRDHKRAEAFFTRNGESMVTKNTFAAVIEALTLQLGLDPNFEALNHLSSYDNKSFALLQPAERKKFLATIVQNLDVYQNIYKTLSKRSSIFKAMVGTLNAKIANLGGNPLNFGELIRKHQLILDSLNAERESLMSQILAYQKTPQELAEYNENVRLAKQLREQYSKLMAEISTKQEAFAASFHYSVSLDEVSRVLFIKEKNLEDFTGKRETYYLQKHDLELGIQSCGDNIYHYGRHVADMLASEDYETYKTLSSDTYQEQLEQARSFIRMASSDSSIHFDGEDITFVRECDPRTLQTFLSLYTKRINEFNRLGHDMLNDNIDAFVKFVDTYCESGTIDLSKLLERKHKLYENMTDGSYDSEGSRNWSISLTIKHLDDLDNYTVNYTKYTTLRQLRIELDQLLDTFHVSTLARLNYFGVNSQWEVKRKEFMEYYDTITLYLKHEEFLRKHEQMVQSQKSGEDISKQIESTRSFVDQNIKQRDKYQEELEIIESNIEELNIDIELCNKTISWLKNLEKLRNSVNSIRDRLEILDRLIKPMPDLFPLQEKVQSIDASIKSENDILYKLRYSSDLYEEYIHELSTLETNYSRIEALKKYCSPSSGIQVIFIDLYINKILEMANNLLSKFFERKFVIQPFKITDKDFRIPVKRNDFPIDDISSLSTSQMTIVNMCICFAIMMHSSSKMNILRLDEMDAPLDEANSYIFPGIINLVMHHLNCEQAFIITHSVMTEYNRYNTIEMKRQPSTSNLSRYIDS